MDEPLEQAQTRHRKEQRDLQSRITQKKKNATKKTRKGVNDECAELERQLKERQEDELRRLSDPDARNAVADEEVEVDGHVEAAQDATGGAAPDTDQHRPDAQTNDELSSKLAAASLSEGQPPQFRQPNGTAESQEASAGGGGGGKKRNRQKERLARRAAEVEAASAAAAAEAATMADRRGGERARMEPVFASHDLHEKEVAPDGHCLFASFADSLGAAGIEPASALGTKPVVDEKPHAAAYKVVRRVAAAYMEAHGDEFAGFLEEPWGAYAAKIRDTAEWGGQLELAALANAYGVEVRVVQDGRTEVISPSEAGGEKKGATVWLAYYRHGYGLGEHYNSLRRKEAT